MRRNRRFGGVKYSECPPRRSSGGLPVRLPSLKQFVVAFLKVFSFFLSGHSRWLTYGWLLRLRAFFVVHCSSVLPHFPVENNLEFQSTFGIVVL